MLLPWISGVWVGLAAMAHHGVSIQPGSDFVRARIVTEHTALLSGQRAWIGITFDIAKGWHLYWNGLNDSGMPVEVSLKLPEGFVQEAPWAWPAPQRHISPGNILDHVYENRVTLIAPVRAPESIAGGTRIEFQAEARWLVCNDVCLPGQARVKLTTTVASAGGPPPPLSPDAMLFAEARARLPLPPPREWEGWSLRWDNGALMVHVPGATRLEFYPGIDSCPLADPIGGAVTTGSRLRLVPATKANEVPRLMGVLGGWTTRRKEPFYWSIDTTLTPPGNDPEPRDSP